MATRFTIESVFKAIDHLSAPVAKMQKNINSMTNRVNNNLKSVSHKMNSVGDGFKKGALYATASLGTISLALKDIITVGANFEQTLVNAAAKFPGEIKKGTEAFKMLENAARKTGAETEFSSSQAAEALNFLAMAGFNAESAVSALPGVVDLATAAQVDLATATDVASDSLGAFGLMTKDSTQLGKNLARVNDIIAKTTTSANTTVEAMFETIKEGAPVATAAGASMETFAALTGELANSGIKGGKAGTVLKNMFIRLQAPTGQAAKVIKRLGVELQDQNGKLRDMPEIIGQFNKATKDMSASQKAAALQAVFGMEAIAGVNVLMQSGEKRLKEYRGQLENAEGSAKNMAAMMRDTLTGDLKSLNSAVEGVKVSIFSMNNGPLREVTGRMTDWVRANGQLIASNIGEFLKMIIDNFESIVTWGKRIAIAIGVFIAFTTVLKTFILVMTAINLVMAMNPIGLLLIGIFALIAAFTALMQNLDGVEAFFNSFDGIIGTALTPIKLLISGLKKVRDFLGFGSNDIEVPEIKTPKMPDSEIKAKTIVRQSTPQIVTPDMTQFENFKSMQKMEFEKFKNQQMPSVTPQIVTPQEKISKQIQETTNNSNSSVEVTIKDESGKAEITKNESGNKVKLQSTGAF